MIKSYQIHLGMVLSRISWDFKQGTFKKVCFQGLNQDIQTVQTSNFFPGHIRSDADVLQRMEVQLKLCGNELQTFGQVVSKRFKMTKRNIFLPDIYICLCITVSGERNVQAVLRGGFVQLGRKNTLQLLSLKRPTDSGPIPQQTRAEQNIS